jgi:protein O-mannosyl-transferase
MNKRSPVAIPGALIILAVVLAYLPALQCGFIWDDNDYVTGNTTLHSLKGLQRIWFELGAVPQYYPLVHTTFWLEYHLWGLNPFGYHLVNVLLHASAAVLLGLCCLRLQIPGAWLAAVIFALHPVGVESVVWITERKNVLSAVFYLAAALTYLRFAIPEATVITGRRYWWFYGAALVLYTAALLSKTVTCSLPAALLLVCWWKKGRLGRGDVLPLLPFFAIGMAGGLLTAWMEKHHVGAQGAEWSLTFADRGLIAGRALWFYAGKLAWPANLTFIYPRWRIDTDIWWQWLFPGLAVCTLAGLWLMRQHIGKGPLVAVMFFVGTLGPALGFINVFPMRYSFVADHFQYLAAAGLIALGATGLNRLPRVMPALVTAMLGLLTWRQAGAYRNLETLWRDTLAKNPDCWMAYNNLGDCLYNQGHIGEATEHYRQAVQLNPNYYEALNNLGTVLAAQDQLAAAIEHYHQAIRIHPNVPQAWGNLGAAFATHGRFEEAIQYFQQSIQLDPNSCKTLYNLGLALAAKGRFAEAAERFQQAARIDPTRAETFLNLGIALAQSGRVTDAAAQYREALKLDPGLTGALNDLAWILATGSEDELRNGAEAVRLAERACELTHDQEPLFIGTLAAAYAEAGRFPEAVSAAEKAEQLATRAGLTNVAAKNRQLLEFYRADKPCHEPPP